jgi:rhamnulokinase
MATGDVKDLKQARKIIRSSFDVKTYEPQQSGGVWDVAYGRFLEVVK